MRVLIFSCYANVERFQLRVDNRTLLWGLDQANIDWELAMPWYPLPDLRGFDAVVSTLYAPYFQNFAFWCRRAERACREAGLPVINSIENVDPPHSYFLQRWAEAGIPCARYNHFQTFEDIRLPLPLILRTDGTHRGIGMYFVTNEEEGRAAIARQQELHERNYPAQECPMPLNVAIEYIDTRGADGLYMKKRCYVVGDSIVPAHCLRSSQRFVNFKDAALNPASCRLDQAYTQAPELTDDRELILRAAHATGFEIITLDYSIRGDGSYVFWEGNRMRGTAGDPRIKWLGVRPADIEYGKVMAEHIRERVEASRETARIAI
jgi:hypothetical protein